MLAALLLLFTRALTATANNFGSDWDHACDATESSVWVGWWVSGYQECVLYSVENGCFQ